MTLQYQKISYISEGTLVDAKVIKRLNDEVFIPFDPANTDYQEYLKWLAEGNEPLPADDPS